MINPDEQDTEILITLVASLLTRKNLEDADILDALVRTEGNVEAAAEILNKQPPSSKRKRIGNNLDNWVKRGRKEEGPSKPRKGETVALKSIKPTSSVSTSKPVDLMTVLRQPPSSPKKNSVPKLPPLTLATPAMIKKHTPCTLHHSVLPQELACELFYTMLDLSKDWQRNKWWLFDRVVESPHRTSFFARRTNGLDQDESWQEAAKYWYNGRMTEAPLTFPNAMEKACRIVEEIVNEEISKRQRYEMEWGVPGSTAVWKANVAASNCYDGSKESVGWHSDQLTYLGPYPTIASLSLGKCRV